MAGRKNTLPDALALMEINGGNPHFEQPHVRMAILMHEPKLREIVSGDIPADMFRLYRLTDAGKEMVEQSLLWAAHQRLLSMGYTLEGNRRRATKNYIPYRRWNNELEREETAWISATRRKPTIFISRRMSEGGSYQLEYA